MSKGLTATIVFEANSLNYGEGIGNISVLKKLNRDNGRTYTFASRQCLGYDIRRLGHELFDWKYDVVVNNETIQYRKDLSIKDSEEMDLFGYFRTTEKTNADTRQAPVRINPAISLEPYRSDMDFLTNKGFADRLNEDPNLTNTEQHNSLYAYTITIDLDKIGVDKVGEDKEKKIEKEEIVTRLKQFLTIIKLLNRNIRGRQENLNPLFIIGGIYTIPNPFFKGRIKLENRKGEFAIKTGPIGNALETTILDTTVRDKTLMGIEDGFFANKEELKALLLEDNATSVEGFFNKLTERVENYYL